MIDYKTYEFSKTEDVLIYVLIALSGVCLSVLFYHSLWYAVVILPFARRIREFVRDWMAERRQRALLEQFKDMLFMVSTSIGAGRGMKDAIGESIHGIKGIYGEKAVLTLEMEKIYDRLEVGNENDVDVLMDFAVRSGLEDVVDFVTVYATCKVTGASLITALNKAASVIIDKMSIEDEIRGLVRRKESEGMILFLMPVIVILFLNLCAPDYIAPLYDSAMGRMIMTGVIASNIGIYALIQKVIKVEI